MTREKLLKKAKAVVFNLEMSIAVINNLKTETRRILKVKDPSLTFKNFQGGTGKICALFDNRDTFRNSKTTYSFECINMKHKVGDILWLREPAKVLEFYSRGTVEYEYLSDHKRGSYKIPLDGQTLPRWITEHQGVPNGCTKDMARIFLEVISVRVEKLNDITTEGIIKEGFNSKICKIPGYPDETVITHAAPVWWKRVWDGTAGEGSKIEDNPAISVTEFRIIYPD